MLRWLELKLPPLAVFVLAGLGMWFLRRVEAASFELPGARIAAAVLFVAGIFVAVRGVLAFRFHETTVHPVKVGEATTVVSSDIYRFTRNPMYLGLTLALAAIGLALGNGVSLAVVPAFMAYLTQFQIKPEERALREKFGEAYAGYCTTTRRWL